VAKEAAAGSRKDAASTTPDHPAALSGFRNSRAREDPSPGQEAAGLRPSGSSAVPGNRVPLTADGRTIPSGYCWVDCLPLRFQRHSSC
jgi:hypothetical protein